MVRLTPDRTSVHNQFRQAEIMVCRKSRRKYVDVVWTFAFWIDAVKTDIHDISDIDRRKLVHQAVFGVIFVLTITSVMGAFQDGFSPMSAKFWRATLSRVEVFGLMFPFAVLIYLKLFERQWIRKNRLESAKSGADGNT